MQFSKYLALIFSGVILFSACSKKEKAVKPSHPDLYFAGSTLTANNNSIATYWKNGTMYQLADTAKNTLAYAIVVSGNDVYVLGNRYNLIDQGFTYWKNGVPTDINSGDVSISGRAMAVQNGNVYVAGEDISKGQTAAAYWVNGVEVPLNATGYSSSWAVAIAVKGSDIYVAGYVITNTGSKAALWKSGKLNILSNPSTPLYNPSISQANDVIINGSDVYVAGIIGGSAGYWKNGVPSLVAQYLLSPSAADGMALSGNDVYLTGTTYTSGSNSNSTPILWKSGIATYLITTLPPSNIFGAVSTGECLAVNGDDVYVSGQFYGYYNCYWKNGGRVQIGGTSLVQSISGMAMVVQ